MSKTQYKFYKTTCTAGNIDTTSATKNPFKLDEVENGGIVLAVNDTSDPNFGRMYFKNPFGTAYDTNGKLFEVGTNVSTLNVNGINSSSSDPGNGRIRIESATYNTCIYPDQMYIKDKSANESVVISKGNIQFTNENADASATIEAEGQLTLKSSFDNVLLNASGDVNIQADKIDFTGDIGSSNQRVANVFVVNIDASESISSATNSTNSTKTNEIESLSAEGINIKSPVTASNGVINGKLNIGSASSVTNRVIIGPGAYVYNNTDYNGIRLTHQSADNPGIIITGGGPDLQPKMILYDQNSAESIVMNGHTGSITVSNSAEVGGLKISNGYTVVLFQKNGIHQMQGSLSPVSGRSLDIGGSNSYIHNLFSEHIYSKKGSLITFTPSGTTYTSDSSSVGTGLLAVFITVGQNNDKTYEITMFIPAVDSPYYYDFRGESGDGAWVKAKISNNRLILDITALSASYPVSNVAAYQILRVS